MPTTFKTTRYFVVGGGREVWLALARSVLWSRRKKPSRRRLRACQASTSQWRRVRRAETPDRYKVGDAEITTSYHGIWEKAHDAQYVGNATVAETKQARANAGLTTEFVPNPITAFAVKLNKAHSLRRRRRRHTRPASTWNHVVFELRAKEGCGETL
jgi:hypothetical protein